MLLLLIACTSLAKTPQFGANGTPQDVGSLDTADTGGGGDTGGDTASDGDPGAPQLGVLTASFVDYPNVGIALEVYITFTDDNNTLVGGKVYPTFTGTTGNADSESYDIGDYNLGETSQAFVDPNTGSLFFAIIGLDETDAYTVDAYVVDTASLTSNSVSGSADPYSG